MRLTRRVPSPLSARRAFVLLATGLALGCGAAEGVPPAGKGEAPSAGPGARAHAGTVQMADTLAALAARSIANPLENPFLNRERGDAIQAKLVFQNSTDAWNGRIALADERLKAGQTRDAITLLARAMREAGLIADSVSLQRKSVYDLDALAYLRLGEQENCIDNPAANVCILPLAGGARHVRQEGARGAISRYTELLRHFPDDHGARWLLNIAYLQVGGYPDSVPPHLLVPNLAPRAGDEFPLFPNIAGEAGLAVTGLAGGLSVEDFNRDGLLDVFTTAWGAKDPIRLMMADGTGRYSDRSAESGLAGITGGNNTANADYDNDGDVDILVLRGGWLGEAGRHPNSLLRNRGDGTFDDVTFESGLASFHPTQAADWGDFNLDGYLDLFVGNESYARLWGGASQRSQLFVNNRDGTFREVSALVGIDLDDFVKAVAWGDVNNDGLPDLYASVIYGPNRLYINRGGSSVDTWRFEERAAASGVERPIASFPTWFWDFDQDGWEDLLVLSYDVNESMHEMVAREYLRLPLATVRDGKTVRVESSRLYRNNGDGTFADVTRRAGLEGKVIYAMGSNYGDLDNDGFLDFYVGTGNPDLRSVIPNRMFRNVGGQRFEEVSLAGGFAHLQKGHATAFADFDRDGDQDVYAVIGGAYQGDQYTSALFENPGWPGRTWIALELEGRAANRSAIGARVAIVVSDGDGGGGARRTIHRTVGTGGSFGAGSLQLHVGLGGAQRVHSLRIQWPDSARSVTTYADLAVGRSYRVVQGEAPVALERPPVPFQKVKLIAPPGEHGHP